MHGWGVSTPNAAAVAAATCGFLGEEHMPNGARFAIGFMSCTVAAGSAPPYVSFVGRTDSLPGKLPIEHASVAPLTTPAYPLPHRSREGKRSSCVSFRGTGVKRRSWKGVPARY